MASRKLGERQSLLASSRTSTRSSSSVAPDSTSSFSCRAYLTSYVPIEPLLFGYTVSRVFVISLTGFYFFDQASHKYGNPSMDSLNPCGQGGHSADRQQAEEVQKYYLQLSMIGAFCDYITAVLPTLFIGPATDTLGRRVGFVLPLLGSIARAIVFLLVLATNASVNYVYIGYVMEGLGGGFGAFFMTSFSAVADVTKKGPQRALRICINEAVIVLGSALSSFVAGRLRGTDYTKPTMVAAAIAVVTLFYALWGWPETRGRHAHQDEITSINTRDRPCVSSDECPSDVRASRNIASSSIMTSDSYASLSSVHSDHESSPESPECLQVFSTTLVNVRQSWRVYFRSDLTSHPARRGVLGVCLLCFLLTVAVNFSKPTVETAYRMSHLCWSRVRETAFDSGWLVQHWVFILIALRVLQHKLCMSNETLALIGCCSAFAAPCIFSIATIPSFSDLVANVLVYVSAGSGTLARLLIPMLRAIASSVVHDNEQGALFASYACVELSGAAVFDLAASQVYRATVHIWPGIIFLIMTSFFLVVMILLVTLSRMLKSLHNTESRTSTHYSSVNQDEIGPENRIA